MSAQYTLSSVSTAGSKILEVADGTNKILYSFPAGTGLVAENYSTSAYDFIITHQNIGKLVIPIAAINTIAGSAPAGNNYATDFASIVAILP